MDGVAAGDAAEYAEYGVVLTLETEAERCGAREATPDDDVGAGAGNLNANAAASAEQKGRQMRAAIQEGKDS